MSAGFCTGNPRGGGGHDRHFVADPKPAMTSEKDPKTIAAQLCQFARTHFVAEGTDFDENSPLAQAGIDSFALVELLLFCERVIGVRVPDSHLTGNNLTSMATLANCIAELAHNGHAAT
jgi:acyl carrier protein